MGLGSSSGNLRILACACELVVPQEERVQLGDGLPQLSECDPVKRVEREDALQDRTRAVRYREHMFEVVRVLQEVSEAFVFRGCKCPRVTTAHHVDKDDSEGPDVAKAGAIGIIASHATQTFYEP